MNFFDEIQRITRAYCEINGLPVPTESSPAADLREAPLIEGDRGNRKGHGVQIRQPGGDVVVPFRKREE